MLNNSIVPPRSLSCHGLNDCFRMFGKFSCCCSLLNHPIIYLSIHLGSYHINDCPVETKIPIFMVVSGVAAIMFIVFSYCFQVYSRWERAGLTKCSIALSGILFVFIFAWNIAGAYWVFKEWDDWEGDTRLKCHKQTYLYIFALSIIYWILLPFGCYAFFKKARDANDNV